MSSTSKNADPTAGSRSAQQTLAQSRDSDVLLSRRIDWRFLLSSPELNRVLYIGSAKDGLSVALRRFCLELETVEPERMLEGEWVADTQFDLLVVADGGAAVIAQGLPHLKRGGAIYWEVRRAWAGDRVGSRFRLARASRYCGQIEELGCDCCGLYWHRPNFVECREIIPLDRKRAIQHAFGQAAVGLKGLAKFLAGHALLRSGLLQYVIPCFSVVGIKR